MTTQAAQPRTAPRTRVSDRYSIAVTIAVLLGSTALLPLTQDRSYLPVAAMLIVALGAISLVVRRLAREPRNAGTGGGSFGRTSGIVLALQVVFTIAYLLVIAAGLGGEGSVWSRFFGYFAEAVRHMQTQPAPMTPNPGVKLLFVTTLGVIMMFTDVMAQAIERPLWTIAPLGFLFLVPALGLRDDVGFWSFLPVAVGYVGILLAEGINTVERWPRGVRRDRADRGGSGLAWQIAAVVAIPALALTLLAGTVLPTRTDSGWGFKKPRGQDGPLQMADPTLDLRRNLNQPEDRTVMTYRSSIPGGTYLRMASLPVFNADGWQNAGLRLTSGSDLPPPPGYKEVPGGRERRTQVQISDFNTEYLPLPFAPDKFDARGDWAYDRESLVVLATGSNRLRATRNLSYSVTSVDIEPDGRGLSSASTGNPPDQQLTVPVPHDIPVEIINLTLRVTAQAPTPALKAAAIQAYLRSPEFTYSTEPQPGSGYQALQNFLLRDKKGYCEQFAGAMAVMARIAGIPSRVAVGFLPGDQNGDDYQVSIRDMHAWPELYFENYGWVRFEPTPSIASPPSWTVQGSTGGDNGESSAPPSPSPEPTPQEVSPTPEAPPPVAEPPRPLGVDPETLRRILLTAGTMVVLFVAAATPGMLRSRRRATRLDGRGDQTRRVENAWAEVRDSVVDYGGAWPAGSPRAIGAQVAHGLDPQAAQAMSSLSLMVERARYARKHSVDADLGSLTQQVRQGLSNRQDGLGRLWATVWPRSLWVNLKRRFQR